MHFLRDVVFLIYISDFSSDSRNDRHRYTVACHFIEVTVCVDAGGSLIELFVGEALQAPAFSRGQLSDSALVVNTVSVLGGQGKHGFLRFLHSSSVLTGLFPFGTENCSGAFLHQHPGMLPTVLADTGILPCRHTSGGIRDLGIGIQVYEVQSCFSTPSSGSGGLGAGDSADIVNPLSLGAWDKLLKIRAIAR